MGEADEHFIDRKYWIPAVWTLLISSVFFLLGLYINSGPQEVIVANPADTVYVAEQNNPNSPVTREQIENIFQRVLHESPQKQPEIVSQSSNNPVVISSNNIQTNPIQVLNYDFSSNVEGYIQKSLNGFANSSCPQGPIYQGDVITVSFNLLNSYIVDKATPIFVRLIQTDNGYLQRFEQQYQLLPGRNVIKIGSNFPTGKYKLSFGFYLQSELNKKYPPYYSRSCTFKII